MTKNPKIDEMLAANTVSVNTVASPSWHPTALVPFAEPLIGHDAARPALAAGMAALRTLYSAITDMTNAEIAVREPIPVYDKLIRMVTAEGDLIFDPMCGSGTTGAVALIRNRRAIQSDINPEYLAFAQARLIEDYTGWAAKLDLACNNPDKIKKPKRAPVVVEDGHAG